MEFLKISLLVLLNLVLVNSIPISDDKEVLDYLQNFGYLTEDEKTYLIDIGNEHKGIKDDNRLKRAFTNLQVSSDKSSRLIFWDKLEYRSDQHKLEC